MLKIIKLLSLFIFVYAIWAIVFPKNISAQCACDCICVQNGTEVGACDCDDPRCSVGSPSMTLWGPNCGSACTSNSQCGGGCCNNGACGSCGGGGGGGGGADTQNGPSCTGNYVVDYTQPISSMCGLPWKDVNYIPGNAQRQEGCCQMAGGGRTCGDWYNCPTRNNPDKMCRDCEEEEEYCAKSTWTTYACKLNCDPNAWGAWGACNVSCGGGVQVSYNNCGTPQWRTCNTQSCQGPWWQVKDGDITTNGDIVSRMPASYYLDTIGSGGFPGVPVYGGQIGVAPGTISSTLWNANTTTVQSRIFNYSYFKNLIPDTIVFNDINKLPNGSGVTVDEYGYEWYKITGNLDTVGNIDFGSRKVILFVEAGNLNIGGNINLTDGVGFFVVFVNGRINIAGTATSLEGIYESDGNITTGVGTSQLLVRGSVATYGSITMQRDLADDTVTPAELFEFAPDQIVLFPKQLQFKRAKWAEVAP